MCSPTWILDPRVTWWAQVFPPLCNEPSELCRLTLTWICTPLFLDINRCINCYKPDIVIINIMAFVPLWRVAISIRSGLGRGVSINPDEEGAPEGGVGSGRWGLTNPRRRRLPFINSPLRSRFSWESLYLLLCFWFLDSDMVESLVCCSGWQRQGRWSGDLQGQGAPRRQRCLQMVFRFRFLRIIAVFLGFFAIKFVFRRWNRVEMIVSLDSGAVGSRIATTPSWLNCTTSIKAKVCFMLTSGASLRGILLILACSSNILVESRVFGMSQKVVVFFWDIQRCVAEYLG